MTLLYQLLSTVIIGLASTALGTLFVLPSSTLKLFSSENTTLDRIMTETEQSLMGSMSSASTLIVTPFCGYFLDTFGRKRTVIMFTVPLFLSWLVLVTIHRVEAVIFAMFLCGLGASILLVGFVYVNEYSDPSIRGTMSCWIIIANGVGVLLSYLVGGTLEYNTMSYMGLTFSAVCLVLVCCLKESPMYLMKKGLDEKAAESIAFFKGTKSYSIEVIHEMENIRRIINADIEIRTTPEEEIFKPDENKAKEKLSTWKFLAKSRSSRRALITLLIICTLCIFQGIIVVQIYAGPLFEAAVPSITATLTTAIFAIITVVAGCFSAYFTDKVGRRILLITSSIVTGIFCVIIASNIQFNWASNLLTAVLIYVYNFTNTIGATTVPYVLLGEVFLPEIKGFATALCMECCFLCNFIVLYMCIPLFNAYGIGPLFLFFGAVSFFTAVFSFIYLPETKSLPADVIQRKFLKRVKY